MSLAIMLLLPTSFASLCDKYCEPFKMCFTRQSCKFYLKETRQFFGPFERCNPHALRCLDCYPHWPCADNRTLAISNMPEAECEGSCAEYKSCFTNDACAYVANIPDQKWSGPYKFCNAVNSACGSCFPDSPCQLTSLIETSVNIHPYDELAAEAGDLCKRCERFRACWGGMACTETARRRSRFGFYARLCGWESTCQMCRPPIECRLYGASTAAVAQALHDTDRTVLELLVASRLLPTATCGTKSVSCGPVGGALRVTSLDLETAARDNTKLSLDVGLTVLQNLTGLTFLRSPGEVYGDLELLNSLTQLMHLSLIGPGITGSMNTLVLFPQLRFLSLRNTMVRGSIAALGQLTALEVLSIQGPSGASGPANPSSKHPSVRSAITGPVASLHGLRALRALNLQSIDVSGELEDMGRPSLQELRLLYLPYVVGSPGPSFKSLSTLMIKDLPNVRVPLIALNDMPRLKILSLTRVQVTGSVQGLQGLGLEHLVLNDPVPTTEDQLDVPLTAVQQMRHLFTLELVNANVHGDVKSLANLSLESLSLQATASGHITGTLHDLLRMPLATLRLQDCHVGGPLGILGNLRALCDLQLVNVPVYGSLHFIRGLPEFNWLFLSGLDLRGDLQPLTNFSDFSTKSHPVSITLRNMNINGSIPPLPRHIKYLDLQANRLFSSTPIVIDAPNLQFLNLKDNGITNGLVQHLNLSSEAVVNLHDNYLGCPLRIFHGVTVLARPCTENAVVFVVLLLVAIFLLMVSAWFLNKHSDVRIPEANSPWTARLRFLGFIILCRCISVADLATDFAGNAVMFQDIASEPSCGHAEIYWRQSRTGLGFGVGPAVADDFFDSQVHFFLFTVCKGSHTSP